MRAIFLSLFALLTLSLFEGCTCCAYLNHIFNADRNYEDATKLEEARADSVPAKLNVLSTSQFVVMICTSW